MGVERVDCESMGLGNPGFADEFVWGEASEGLEALQLLMGFVEVAVDGRVFTVGLGMFRLGQPMIGVVLGASVFEGVRPDGFSGVESRLDVRRGRTRIAWRGDAGWSAVKSRGSRRAATEYAFGGTTDYKPEATHFNVLARACGTCSPRIEVR
jgi:hypothetical protein